MTCITLRRFGVPAIAAVMAISTCAAFAQGSGRPLGFLDELFGNSDRFSSGTPAPQAEQPPPQAQQPGSSPQTQPDGRYAQGPGELTTRIERLEAQIRQLTGTIEELQHRNQQLEAQLRRTQGGDTPASPHASAAPPPVTAPPVTAPPAAAPPATAPSRRSDVFDPTQNPNAPGAPRVLGTLPSGSVVPSANGAQGNPYPENDAVGAPGGRAAGAPLDLSTLAAPPSTTDAGPQPRGETEELPAPPPSNPSGTGARLATLPPSNSPRDAYDLAYGYVRHKDYSLAEEAFRNFLQRFPDDRLVPDAQYWLGETLFQRQRYRDAAEIFLNVSTKHETSVRAPDALLRLGQSLAAMGEREAACASLGEVLRKYPRASIAIRQSVDREQRRVRC